MSLGRIDAVSDVSFLKSVIGASLATRQCQRPFQQELIEVKTYLLKSIGSGEQFCEDSG